MMIAVYAVAVVKADKTAEFEAIIKPLVAASKQDQGCISYGCGVVQNKPHTYAFVENWQSMANLESHMQQPHFTQAGTKLVDLLACPLDINVVALL